MALSLVLLIGAGLLIRSAVCLRGVQPGVDTRNVLTFKTALTGARYSSTAAVAQFGRLLVERLESLPGVQAAGDVMSLPAEPGPDLPFQIEGRPASAGNASGDGGLALRLAARVTGAGHPDCARPCVRG